MTSYDEIKQICSDFVNDEDTTIGMQCLWADCIIKEVNVDLTCEQIKNALNTREDTIPITVNHDEYGEMDVYVGIYGNRIVISPKEYLVKNI
jgi:hypothetical protein